ncbi:MAG: hypothetical protein H0W66_01385 [Chthoniobacterales bacterium]|nr:hypothetical protein [Chthoniobacterales bacterium]
MSTPQQTDERLRSWLDANQLARERLSVAVLALDKRFSSVTSRHPRGGPDGGRDIEAFYQNSRKAFAAVGFVNSACDSPRELLEVRNKFKADLLRALVADNALKVFVFFTNVSLTVSEKDGLMAFAIAKGIEVAEIFDRERLRIALDSAEGLGLRFQYLSIPLSEPEQAAFFARWGSGLEELITKSMEAVDGRLDRLEFFEEQSRALKSLSFHFKLKREVLRTELPHFRALFVMLFANDLPLQTLNIATFDDMGYWQPTSDTGDSGIFGISWVKSTETESKILKTSIAHRYEPLSQICGTLSNDHILGQAILSKSLKDLDQNRFHFYVDAAIADLIDQVVILANQYIVWRADRSQLRFDNSSPNIEWPIKLAPGHVSTRWKSMMGQLGYLTIDFSQFTPKRLYRAERILHGFAQS